MARLILKLKPLFPESDMLMIRCFTMTLKLKCLLNICTPQAPPPWGDTSLHFPEWGFMTRDDVSGIYYSRLLHPPVAI